MFKKVFVGFILLLGLGSLSLEASQPGQPVFSRLAGRVMKLPDFGSPYAYGHTSREMIIADRVEAFVRNGDGSASQADRISWINELKKHLVQCDRLNLDEACLYKNGETCSLNHFVNTGLDIMCKHQSLDREIQGRASMVKEAFRVAAMGWTIIGEKNFDKGLLEVIQQCIGNKDDAIFEGRVAYIEHMCDWFFIDVTNQNVGKRSISAYLAFIADQYPDRVRKLKKTIAFGQLKKRSLEDYVNNMSMSVDSLVEPVKTYVSWARQALRPEQGGSEHEPFFDDWEERRDNGQERGAHSQISFHGILRSAGIGIKKYQNFLFGALGTVTLAAIVGALWFNLARDRRQVIVRR